VLHWADHRPAHPAIVFGDATISYAELETAVGCEAGRLAALGVERGDRVALCALNRVEFLTVLFACARIGAVLVPLNHRLSVGELTFQLDDAAPRVALAGDGFVEHVGRAAPALPVVDLDRERATEEAGLVSTGGSASDPVLMMYTSGTTGRPKGAVHTGSSLLYTVLNGVAHQDLAADHRILSPLPMFHVGGLNIQTLPALYVGATVHLHRTFDPTAVLADIAAHRMTHTLLVPAMLAALVDHPDFATTDLASLRGITSGSSVVPAHLIRPFVDRGIPIGQVYGSTETGPTAVVLRYEHADRVGSCGKPALHTEVRLVDDRGRDVPDDAPGEVLLRGPNIFREYWHAPDATADVFVDGWYRTGDVGRRDGDGFLHIEDRLKDMLISGGENVYPAEVENVLAEHPEIAEVAVIGRHDPRWGEVPVAVVVPTDPKCPLTLDALREWSADRLARYKQPTELIVVDSLPRTALGKVTKHELRAELLA
jgi:fatty-acyl-CoA synthase